MQSAMNTAAEPWSLALPESSWRSVPIRSTTASTALFKSSTAITKIEIALMISSVLLVMAVELLNSAVEAVVDRIGTERHELSGRAKDQGSAAVFIALCIVVVVWGSILFF